MSTLNKTQFATTYEDSGSGRFLTNTTQAIGSDDLRQFAEDIGDSFLNITDNTSSNPSATNQFTAGMHIDALGTGAFVKYVTIGSAAVLTAKASPVEIVAAPGAGYVIMPIMIHCFLDYNSAAYATNTTFRFEINTRAVTNTNTGLLPATADRHAFLMGIDVDSASLTNSALVFEVQSGNPTAGNSPIYVCCVYRVVNTGELA